MPQPESSTPDPFHALTPLLDALAAKTPAPGGGAVGPAIGAIAAAQASMVVAYSVGKKSLADHKPELESAASALERSRAVFLELAREDAAAFEQLQPFFSMKEDDPARAGIADAAQLAAMVPASALAACVDLLRLLQNLVPITNTMLASDLSVSAVSAEAAARASAHNVRVNLPLLTEPGRLEAETNRALKDAIARARTVERAVTRGTGADQ